jgi:uncharacterized protein (DUF1810 family)
MTSFASWARSASIYSRVVEELTDGRKKTHWMWFVFPQVAGLGRTATAQHYAIRDLDQARRYLADPTLGPRLRRAVKLMIDQKAKSSEARLLEAVRPRTLLVD